MAVNIVPISRMSTCAHFECVNRLIGDIGSFFGRSSVDKLAKTSIRQILLARVERKDSRNLSRDSCN